MIVDVDVKDILTLPKQTKEDIFLDLCAKDRLQCEKSYYHFFQQAWKILEPETKLDKNWHIKYLCDILQEEVERIVARKPKDKDLIINVPPRSGKSYVVTVMLAPWIWTRYPWMKIINSSFSMELSTKLCLDSRRLLLSEWYKNYWGKKFHLSTDMNVKSWYENNRGGMRKSTSTGAQITGTGADIIIVDDPADPEKAESEVERETVKRYYGKTLYSRLNNQIIGLRVIIMQRLHEEDLTGHLIENERDSYRYICIPAEITDHIHPRNLIENYVDGLFFPARFSRDILDQAKLSTNLGAYGYSGQMLQQPSPPEGGLFKRCWWVFWKPKGQKVPDVYYKNENGESLKSKIVELPAEFDIVIDSWDTAIEGTEKSDDVAGGKWSKKGATKFLLDLIKGKLDFPATKRAVKTLKYSNSATSTILIEKTSNGPAVKADLDATVPGIICIPTGKLSKEDRVKISDTVPYTAQCQAGNIVIPHPSLFPWVDGYIEEHANFPKTAQDGQVDQGAQAVNFLSTKKHVWPHFQPMSSKHVCTFKIGWRRCINQGALFLSKDMKLSFMCAVWDKSLHKLFIYGELIATQLSLTQIAKQMFRGMKMGEKKARGIYANDLMFKEDTKSTSALLNTELRTLHNIRNVKTAVPIIQPYEYDRLGSINLINLMFSRGEIVVHKNCRETARQISSWYIEKDKPFPMGFELCEALTHIVSELNRTAVFKKKEFSLPDYPAIHKEDEGKVTKNMWQTQ